MRLDAIILAFTLAAIRLFDANTLDTSSCDSSKPRAHRAAPFVRTLPLYYHPDE